jgi:hypothetical protein
MRPLFYALIALTLAACGRTDYGVLQQLPDQDSTVTVTSTSTSTATDTGAQAIVDQVNSERQTEGYPPLTQGLSCWVQLVSSGYWLSTSSPDYPGSGAITLTGTQYPFLMSGDLNMPNVIGTQPDPILPNALAPLFEGKNFEMTCSGQIVVMQPGYQSFDVSSDDGSILTIDGQVVAVDDGAHAVSASSGSVFLSEGVHGFQIQYAQSAGGYMALVVQMNGSTTLSPYFYH